MQTQSITTTIRELRRLCSKRKRELLEIPGVTKEISDDIKILINIKNKTGGDEDWTI